MTTTTKHFRCELRPDMWMNGECGNWSEFAVDRTIEILEIDEPTVDFVRKDGNAMRSISVCALSDRHEDAQEMMEAWIDDLSTKLLERFESGEAK